MLKFLSMDTWAVIKTGGKQYKVSVGQKVEIEKVRGKTEGPILFDEVLAVMSDNGLQLGKPLVEKAKVKGKIIEVFKDKKIRVVKFKSKSRYLRTASHRQQKTRVLIEKIES